MPTTTPPREGLPPCIHRSAILDDRQASWHKTALCKEPCRISVANLVSAGRRNGHLVLNDCSNGTFSMTARPAAVRTYTDSPAEAEAAWTRAEHWVRTGELP
jgi:hypothetical protein